jgi:hypothetical protein
MASQSPAKPADDVSERPALTQIATRADCSAVVAEFDRLWAIDTTGLLRARMDELLVIIQEFEKNGCPAKHSDCDAS